MHETCRQPRHRFRISLRVTLGSSPRILSALSSWSWSKSETAKCSPAMVEDAVDDRASALNEARGRRRSIAISKSLPFPQRASGATGRWGPAQPPRRRGPGQPEPSPAEERRRRVLKPAALRDLPPSARPWQAPWRTSPRAALGRPSGFSVSACQGPRAGVQPGRAGPGYRGAPAKKATLPSSPVGHLRSPVSAPCST